MAVQICLFTFRKGKIMPNAMELIIVLYCFIGLFVSIVNLINIYEYKCINVRNLIELIVFLPLAIAVQILFAILTFVFWFLALDCFSHSIWDFNKKK